MKLSPERQTLVADHIRLAPACVRKFLRRLGVSATPWQEEVLQGRAMDALCSAGLHWVPGRAQFRSYAWGCMRRSLWRAWGRKGLRASCPAFSQIDYWDVVADQILVEAETEPPEPTLESVLALLPEREAGIVRMVLVECRSFVEVARETRLQTWRVSLILRRARRQLRAALACRGQKSKSC